MRHWHSALESLKRETRLQRRVTSQTAIRCLVLSLLIVSFVHNSLGKTLKASLSGKVTNAGMNGVEVRLKAAETIPGSVYDGYSTRLQPDGSFHFEDIDPGRYVLVVDDPRFMPYEYGASGTENEHTPIELRASQHVKGVAIKLTPKYVICGTVTDEKGNPLPKRMVEAFRVGTLSSQADDSANKRMTTDADAHGNYRFPNLPPGEYFIQVYMSWFTRDPNLDAARLANASPVEVGPGENRQCAENVAILPSHSSYFGRHIRGEIAEDFALPDADLVLSLVEINEKGVERILPGVEKFNPERRFDLWGVPDAHYRLILSRGRFPYNTSPLQPEFHILSSQEITVNGADVNEIVVKADPLSSASLTGQVTLEGITSNMACPTQGQMQISIEKSDDGQFQRFAIAKDGKFAFPHVGLGTYSVRIYPTLRGAAYVQSMLLDGEPIEGREINFSQPGGHTLQVVLGAAPMAAPGHIRPSDSVEHYEPGYSHPKASVSGRVVGIAHGDVPWVRLWAARFNSEESSEYSTRPSADGTFHFNNIDPGVYVLLTQGTGYEISEYGALRPGLQGAPVVLKAGDRLQGIKLSAFKRPQLCGRVFDENGQPAALTGVTGLLAPISPLPKSGTRLAPTVFTHTDEQGNYRFQGIEPGRYLLWAWSALGTPSGEMQIQTQTYFPSSATLENAQPIEVGFNDAECKYDIRIRSTPKFHIRGKLPEPIPHKASQFFDVILTETNAAGVDNFPSQVRKRAEPGDTFDFGNVHPGHYVIRVQGPREGPKMWSGPCAQPMGRIVASQAVTVSDANLNTVSIPFSIHASLTGIVRLDDVPKKISESVSLVPLHDTGQGIQEDMCSSEIAKVNVDGQFSFEGLDEGNYELVLGQTRAPLYLKSVILDDKELVGTQIALWSGKASRLTIMVRKDSGTVDTTLLQVEPVPEPKGDQACRVPVDRRPQVFLIPDDAAPDWSRVLYGWPTSEGFVRTDGIPPGRYRVIATDNLHLDRLTTQQSNQRFIQALASLGRVVEVAANQKIQLSVPSSTVEIQKLLEKFSQPIRQSDCVGKCSIAEFWTE